MTDEIEKNPDASVEVVETEIRTDVSETGHKSRARVLWIISVPSILIILGIAVVSYLAVSGVNIAYAVGTSGWAAPPGTKIGTKDIGGKTLEEILPIIDEMDVEFGGVSVWLAENQDSLIRLEEYGSVSVVGDDFAISAAPSEIGLHLDTNYIKRQISSIADTSSELTAFNRRIALWQEPPSIDLKLALDEDQASEYLYSVKSTWDTEPVDAKMDLPNRLVHPSNDGIEIRPDETLALLPGEIEAVEDLIAPLILFRTQPKVTNDAFDGFDLDHPLAEYTTSFNRWKRNRSFNIELVASHFEAVVIQPGEVFSFNATTGPRDLAQGYLLAPMYMNRRPELSPAGGACQVSTTLYNAALLAGFEIVQRYPHSRPCSYVPYGRDATVAYDSEVDLKIKNTLDHAVILHQEVDRQNAGTITFTIFGNPEDRAHVEIGNAYSWIGRGEPEYVIDRSLAPGEEVVEDEGVTGISQRAWRTWFDDAGNELYTEQLSSDRVRPVGAYIRHNPAEPTNEWVHPNEVRESIRNDEEVPETPPPGMF
jgi:vancomycin resistance protein YoaR